MSILDNLSDEEFLILTIIGEARGEPIEGQVAVGNVILNRLRSNKKKYSGFKDVVLEPYQFSCWLEEDPNLDIIHDIANKMILGEVALLDQYIKQCIWVGRGIAEGMINDNTHGSLHYLSNWLFSNINSRPSWAKTPLAPKTIGKQTFFNV